MTYGGPVCAGFVWVGFSALHLVFVGEEEK